MSHAASDEDWYTVVVKPPTKKKKYSTHRIIDSDDSVVVDFGTWLTLCEKGVPQALEAMFSTQPVTDKLAALRAGYRAGPAAYDTYLRTIKSFAMQDEFKPKRHALRLALNMYDMRMTGRFNPTLSVSRVNIISHLANQPAEWVYEQAKEIAWGLDRPVDDVVD
jgi:hypothetical protein